MGSADDSGSTSAAQAAAGSVQNLFGRLLLSLEQVIGLQLSAAKPAATAAAATAGAGATASTVAAPASTQSASTLLQNYLNNLSPRADSSRIPKAAGSNVKVDA